MTAVDRFLAARNSAPNKAVFDAQVKMGVAQANRQNISANTEAFLAKQKKATMSAKAYAAWCKLTGKKHQMAY